MSSTRRVVIVPGRNMGPYVPQLLFPAFAAIRRGAQTTPIEWRGVEAVDQLEGREVEEWVTAQVDPVVTGLDPSLTVLVGKSLGTYAAAVASRVAIPAVWVTPLLTDTVVVDALARATAPFLLVGGTADPMWESATARRLTPHVLELPDADHGLFVPGPLERSANNMAKLATATERFLEDNGWPAPSV